VKKVLIVDSDAQFRAVLRYGLERADYVVGVAVDGAEALREVSAEAYDLVILDLLLPEVGGLEVVQRIKSDPQTRDVPVIVLSAVSGGAYSRRATELGASRYVAKPVSLERLVAEIGEILEGRAPVVSGVRGGTPAWGANHH